MDLQPDLSLAGDIDTVAPNQPRVDAGLPLIDLVSCVVCVVEYATWADLIC